MSELACLELSVLLWIVHVLVQATAANATLPVSWLVGARDVTSFGGWRAFTAEKAG